MHIESSNVKQAAIVAVLSFLKLGDTLLKADDLYAGSITSIETHAQRVGAKVKSFSDTSHLSELLAQGNVAMVWLETPTNPMLKVFDIQLVAELAHDVGAKLIVDNTFMSPALQRPLTLGADISVNSVSKYIGGHSDVVMGVASTADERFGSLLRTVQANDGAVPSPFDCFLALRGIRTLPLRIGRQCENAMEVALALTQNEAVEIVRYPGLPKHAEHELMKVQADGFGAMISFTVLGGTDEAMRLLSRCKLITPAVSLGGVETVIEHPASMTHRSIPNDERLAIGITDNLLRLSVGIESAADIISDLEQALK